MHPIDRILRASLLIAAFLASAAVWWPAPAAGRAHQGSRLGPGRAQQPAGRLRPRRRPRRHRRPDDLGAVHDAEPARAAAADGRDGAGRHQHAAEERRRGDGDGAAAARSRSRARRSTSTSRRSANAKSLRGGTLIATPLKGADGQIYAIAQGNLVVGGAGASAAGSKVQINHLSAGRIPDGATVERASPTPLAEGDSIQLDLQLERLRDRARGRPRDQRQDGRRHRRRRSTAASCACACRHRPTRASPSWPRSRTSTSSRPTPSAKVVINARTGSIVMNQAVTLAACAVAHGNLSVTISTDADGEPARRRSRGRPDGGHREGRHHDHAAGRLAGPDGRRAPSSPTSSRRSTRSARRRRTCSRSCRR